MLLYNDMMLLKHDVYLGGRFYVEEDLFVALEIALPNAGMDNYCILDHYLAYRDIDEVGQRYVDIMTEVVFVHEVRVSVDTGKTEVILQVQCEQDFARYVCCDPSDIILMTRSSFEDKGIHVTDDEQWKRLCIWLTYTFNLACQEKLHVYEKAGWRSNGSMDGFVLDRLYVCDNNKVVKEKKSYAVATPESFEPVGKLEHWLSAVQKYVIGNVLLELAVAISLAAPLFALLNAGVSPIFAYIGESSTGKSTALKLALSVWCAPEKRNGSLYKTWNGTANSILDLCRLYCGLPIGIDDTSSASKFVDTVATLYQIAEGSTKGRSSAQGQLQTEETNYNAFIVTAESSQISDKATAGMFYRYFELYGKATKDAEHAEALNSIIVHNHGLLGPVYIKYLLSIGRDRIEIDYQTAIQMLKQSAVGVNTPARMIDIWAMLLVALQYFDQLLKVMGNVHLVDLDEICAYMVHYIDHQSELVNGNVPEAQLFLYKLVKHAQLQRSHTRSYGVAYEFDGKSRMHKLEVISEVDEKVHILGGFQTPRKVIHRILHDEKLLVNARCDNGGRGYSHDTKMKRMVGKGYEKGYGYEMPDDLFRDIDERVHSYF